MSRADPDGSLQEGDVISIGSYRFEVLHTPGHSPGHISLVDRETGILFAGDLVGDIVAWYTPASGGVTGYLESLEKIRACSPRLIMPSHGAVIDDPIRKIDEVRERLLAREKKMLDILSEGRISFVDLVCRMFSNEMVRFFPGTGITESHVQKLAADGRITRDDTGIRMA
jgi:glyoxylase-like metal-dependent hydrolase (beta-lactamase superfamily II)